MKKIIIVLALAAFIIACGSGDSATTEGSSSAAESATASIDGKEIYKQYCLTCHGLYGDMGASGAFNLQTSTLSVEERVGVITNGRNVMTPFKAILNPEEIQAVAKYTLELKKD